MSIASEIARLISARADIRSAIIAKDVSVPSDAVLEDMPTYIAQIQSGSSCDMYAGNEAPSGASSGDLWVDTASDGGVFHEHGSIAFHTGSNTTEFAIPVSNTSYDNYLVIATATKTWKKVGSTWVEDAGRNFSGLFTSSTLIGDSLVFLYPNKYTESITASTGVKSSPIPTLEYSININAYNASSNPARAALATSVTLNNGAFSGKVTTNHYLCRSTVGQTFEYDIYGWN